MEETLVVDYCESLVTMQVMMGAIFGVGVRTLVLTSGVCRYCAHTYDCWSRHYHIRSKVYQP